MTCTNKLKPMMFTNIYVHDALEGGCQHIMWWWFANQTAWMKSYVFESWMMSLNVHFESQKQTVFLIKEIYAPHSLKHVGRGELFGFQPLQLNKITMVFLPPNATCGTILGSSNNCFI